MYDGLFSIEKSVLDEENWGIAADQGRIKVLKECKNAFCRYVPKFDYLALRLFRKCLVSIEIMVSCQKRLLLFNSEK